MGTVAEKLTYLNGTKSSLKTAINNLGGDITSSTTFRNYATELNDIYDNLPKVSDTGTNVSLSPTLKGRLGIVPKGNTLQDGTPTPSTPVEIQSATGTQKVVVSGKNKIDLSKEPLLTQYSNSNFIEPNISIIKTASNQNAYCIFEVGDAKLLDGKILKFTGELVSGTGRAIIGYADSNGENRVTVDGNVNIQSGTFQRTITVDGTTYANKKVIIWLYSDVSSAGSVGDTLTYKNVMISTTGGEYQPYQEPQEVDIELGNIELNKIGNYEDYIGGTPDNWVLYKNIGKVVLDGSESYSSMGWGSNKYAYRTSINNIKQISNADEDSNIISNYYESYSFNGLYNLSEKYGVCNRLNQSEIIIRNDDYSTNTELKNWLSTHNTELLYVLAETQQTPITEENLVSQLNELYYLMSYNDTTNIDVTGNLPMRITASAIKGA